MPAAKVNNNAGPIQPTRTVAPQATTMNANSATVQAAPGPSQAASAQPGMTRPMTPPHLFNWVERLSTPRLDLLPRDEDYRFDMGHFFVPERQFARKRLNAFDGAAAEPLMPIEFDPESPDKPKTPKAFGRRNRSEFEASPSAGKGKDMAVSDVEYIQSGEPDRQRIVNNLERRSNHPARKMITVARRVGPVITAKDVHANTSIKLGRIKEWDENPKGVAAPAARQTRQATRIKSNSPTPAPSVPVTRKGKDTKKKTAAAKQPAPEAPAPSRSFRVTRQRSAGPIEVPSPESKPKEVIAKKAPVDKTKKPAQSKKNRKTAKTEPTSTQTEPTTDAPPPRRSARLRAQSPAVASNANAVTSAPPARSASKPPAPAQEVKPEATVQDEAPPVAPARPVTPPARSADKRPSPSPETLRRIYGSAALDAVNHDGYESDESSLIPEPIINKSLSPSPEILRLIMGNKAAAPAPAPVDDDGYESDQSSVYPEPVLDVRKDFDAGEREEHAMFERRAARLKAQQDKTADRYANTRTSAPPARSASKSPAPAQEIQPEITVHDEAPAVPSPAPAPAPAPVNHDVTELEESSLYPEQPINIRDDFDLGDVEESTMLARGASCRKRAAVGTSTHDC